MKHAIDLSKLNGSFDGETIILSSIAYFKIQDALDESRLRAAIEQALSAKMLGEVMIIDGLAYRPTQNRGLIT
jgi:hypothetical protein